MPSLKELKTQIENANALGVANLTEKGVNLPENATTYEIMQGIAEVTSGDATTDYEQTLYDSYGVDKNEYPYLIIKWQGVGSGELYGFDPAIYFLKGYLETDTGVNFTKGYKYAAGSYFGGSTIPDTSVITIVNRTMQVIHTPLSETTNTFTLDFKPSGYYVTNIPLTLTEYSENIMSLTDANKSEVDIIEDLIDNSGVLEDTEGSVSEKIEELIDYANFKNILQEHIDNCRGAGAYDAIFVFRNTSIKDVSMFDFSTVGNMSGAFTNTKIEEIEIDVSSSVNMSSTFKQSRNLKSVVIKNMTSKTTDVRGMCAFCSALESIGVLDFSGCTARIDGTGDGIAFRDCPLLKEISIVENSIKVSINFGFNPLLSTESIQSIIDGLAYVETAQTLTLHSAITLTDEQKATINAKGWTLAQ